MAPKLDDFMQWPEIEALEYGECSRPQDVLGARMADRSHVLVTAYFPEVDSVAVRVAGAKKEYKMEEADQQGYYGVLIPGRKIPEYVFMVCLLYTSDAADDMQCVDLGGRRIIKKKK